MLINDFKEGGFPISNHTPIICVHESGKATPVYSYYDLKETITNNKIIHLLGVWPGKRNTDCYPLDILIYSKVPIPPVLHKNIDSAVKIVIIMESGEFSKVVYRPGPKCDNKTALESNDKELYEYIKKVGLNYKIKYI